MAKLRASVDWQSFYTQASVRSQRYFEGEWYESINRRLAVDEMVKRDFFWHLVNAVVNRLGWLNYRATFKEERCIIMERLKDKFDEVVQRATERTARNLMAMGSQYANLIPNELRRVLEHR
ncbi:MAG: hypothetical protein ACREC3_05910 [Methyloceanibacter sp.]